jgi:D-alanyl-D-alanine carboxypeptidase
MIYKLTTSVFLLYILAACTVDQQQNPSAKKVSSDKTLLVTVDTIRENYLTKEYLMGKFDPSSHQDFSKIEETYTAKKDIYMRTDAYEAFKTMAMEAKKVGIQFKIVSATRPFNYQKGIWERKWNGITKVRGEDLTKTHPGFTQRALKILEYSSMPGTSRHHWGTDIDLNNLENDYFESGQGLKEYEWLKANAGNYGFCQVYSEKGEDRPFGYNLEKWHWSYLPVASKLTSFAKTQMNNNDIKGFDGDNTTDSIDVINKYILGINPNCN